MTLAALERLADAGGVTPLDLHFARLMARMAGSDAPELVLGACLASRRTSEGHVCVDLGAIAGRPIVDDAPDAPVAPDLARWTAALRASPVVATAGERRPMVLDAAGRLYLHRYWDYERRLAAALRARAAALVGDVDEARLGRDVAALFPAPGLDWQRVAAVTAVLRRLCVVSGGPGTGKTYTVLRMLALVLAQRPTLRVALAAPTGKAAARLQEAVRLAAHDVPLDAAARAAVLREAATVHRLLGARPDGVSFRHDAKNLLPYDVVVVDEASMVDLALMTKLVEALPAPSRLVLLGDKDQLASVEAGAVLGDVCGPAPGFSAAFAARVTELTGVPVPPAVAETASPLGDAVVLLRESRRFAADSGIGQVAAAINRGDGAVALARLEAGGADVAWLAVGSPAELDAALATVVRDGYGPACALVTAGAPAPEVLAAFARFRILCAHRAGPGGVESLDRDVERHLAAAGLIAPRGMWYAGRPVMITRNDHAQGLWNGDVGIALPGDDGNLRVWFEDGRAVSPVRLPPHETVWAMTVHKSQGSEFDDVVLVLPPHASRVTTRELLYTGLTRARRHVGVWGTPAVFLDAVTTRLERASGLRDALWS